MIQVSTFGHYVAIITQFLRIIKYLFTNYLKYVFPVLDLPISSRAVYNLTPFRDAKKAKVSSSRRGVRGGGCLIVPAHPSLRSVCTGL